ncbi:hypothetical protein C3V36_06435 [Lachnospiraceae bacterium oral taxon 500]|nr:hypothetical protein C3V36_06435 [Lachnospiraceae bacterium oral taxon 500]
MKISEVIQKVKKYHYGYWNGPEGPEPINEEITRDKILFGNPEVECTGIVTTCWAHVNVIKEAIRQGANLIICHEALFWNHGDHTDWLEEQNNLVYRHKAALLKQHGIVVWRNHDYVHSGIPISGGRYADGIFYGLASVLGWLPYIDEAVSEEITLSAGENNFPDPKKVKPLSYTIPAISVEELAKFLTKRLKLNGVKIMGNPAKKVSRLSIPPHVLGDAKFAIGLAAAGKADCFLTMEIVDFTLAEYVRDASLTDDSTAIIGMGHFNVEEPGMEYMTTYLPQAIEADIPCTFIPAGDHYHYLTKETV